MIKRTSFDGMVDYPLSMIITEQGECLAYSINADIQSIEMQLLQLMIQMTAFNLDNHLRKSDRTWTELCCILRLQHRLGQMPSYWICIDWYIQVQTHDHTTMTSLLAQSHSTLEHPCCAYLVRTSLACPIRIPFHSSALYAQQLKHCSASSTSLKLTTLTRSLKSGMLQQFFNVT